jgi:hypothetical protein
LSHSPGNSEAIRRHNQIANAIVNAVEMAGGKAWTEPRFQIQHSDDQHTDIRVALGPHLFYIDVQVVHPTANSYVSAASKRHLATAGKAEREKDRQYKAKVEQEKAIFYPFVLETFGGWGNRARSFANKLADYALSGCALWKPSDIRRAIQRGVQDALMVGNMRMLNGELTKCHRAPPPRLIAGLRTLDSSEPHPAPTTGSQPQRPRARPRAPSLQQRRQIQEAFKPTTLLSVSFDAEAESVDRTVADGARDAAADMNIEITVETGQSTVGAEGLGQEEVEEAEAAGAEDGSGDPAPVDDVLQAIFASQEGEDALWRELLASQEAEGEDLGEE